MGGQLAGSASKDMTLNGVAPLDKAVTGQLSFLTNTAYASELPGSKASVVVLKEAVDHEVVQWVHPNPYWAFAKVAALFAEVPGLELGIAESAFVDVSASIGEGVAVGEGAYVGAGAYLADGVKIFPHAYIGPGVKIGKDTEIRSGVRIEYDCEIGAQCLIHANTVIGSDGFGFAPDASGLEKIPQTGTVIVEDQVEMGSLCNVDRGTFGPTRIGFGTKMDSHVHVAHNVQIGKHNTICALVGIAGSAVIGDWCVFGGNAAVSNHMKIGNQVRVGAKAGVTHDLKDPGDYMGFPAIPARDWRRMVAGSRRVAGLEKRIRELEKQVGAEES